MMFYTDPTRQADSYSLPDARVYQLTAREVVEQDVELIREYMRRYEYRLAGFSSRVSDAMLDKIVDQEGITGGWFFDFCVPGCLPDSQPFGPYATHDEAISAARDMVG